MEEMCSERLLCTFPTQWQIYQIKKSVWSVTQTRKNRRVRGGPHIKQGDAEDLPLKAFLNDPSGSSSRRSKTRVGPWRGEFLRREKGWGLTRLVCEGEGWGGGRGERDLFFGGGQNPLSAPSRPRHTRKIRGGGTEVDPFPPPLAFGHLPIQAWGWPPVGCLTGPNWGGGWPQEKPCPRYFPLRSVFPNCSSSLRMSRRVGVGKQGMASPAIVPQCPQVLGLNGGSETCEGRVARHWGKHGVGGKH